MESHIYDFFPTAHQKRVLVCTNGWKWTPGQKIVAHLSTDSPPSCILKRGFLVINNVSKWYPIDRHWHSHHKSFVWPSCTDSMRTKRWVRELQHTLTHGIRGEKCERNLVKWWPLKIYSSQMAWWWEAGWWFVKYSVSLWTPLSQSTCLIFVVIVTC